MMPGYELSIVARKFHTALRPAEIQPSPRYTPSQIAVGPRRESRRIVAVDTLDNADTGRAPSRRQTRQAEIHAVTPFPNCAAWDSSRASNLTIVEALPNKLKDSLYFGARSH